MLSLYRHTPIMNELYDIFISYSSKDSHIVHDYAKYLEKAGYRVWYDVKGLYTGAQFSQEIVNAIDNSKLFIFFSSENSNKSEWTKGEILTAQKFKKQILPIRIDDSDYDKSLMLILLPLQYIETSKCVDTNEELRRAVAKFIGEPTLTSRQTELQNTYTPRKAGKLCITLSVIVSLFFSFFMMYISGEYWLNMSLSLFTIFISTAVCMTASLYIIKVEKNWNRRATIVNISFLVGVLFFLSYSITAFGLCFISPDVFSINSPSIVCAALAIFAISKLMSFKKIGYTLLWISAFLFSIGSYWWLNNISITVLLSIIACICMSAMTLILRVKYEGSSLWEKLS